MVKNSVMSNRCVFEEQVDKIVGEVGGECPKFPLKKLVALSASISILDTLFTQYHANMRILYSMGKNPDLTPVMGFKL